MIRPVVLTGAAVLALTPASLSAQSDVEMLGRVYGTTPPPEYFEVMEADRSAFTFQRAWRSSPGRESEGDVPGGPLRQALLGLEATEPGARSVEGTVRFPLVLGVFRDSPTAPFAAADVQREFFDGPNSRFRTIPDFYREISGGRVELVGETFPWVRSGLSQVEAAGGSSGLGGEARVGEFILSILSALDDGTVDWGRYDNDGPDGVPNSGDDDGWVDVLAVMHPTHGGECGGEGRQDRIWSHKWTLEEATGQSYVTGTPAAGGGRIRIGNYTIQPVFSCDAETINEIGVLAHELGHGFGLPDLYAVGADHQGIGSWGLMGSGSWGCGPFSPERPCHMSAWSKAVLGWVDVETAEPGRDHGTLTLPPVETRGTVVRVDAGDGSGEYFLLENRQPVGFDAEVPSPGLLVWHVDPSVVEEEWDRNRVNSDASRMGVWLRQADGLDQLAVPAASSGDPGDPFPGQTDNRVFHAGSQPSAFTHEGGASGLTLLDIRAPGPDVTFRLLTRFQEVTVRAEGTSGDGPELVVDGVPATGVEHAFRSAPFQRHRILADGGAPVGEGVRMGFLGWADDLDAPRERLFQTGLADADLVARYGNREVRLRLAVEGGAFGVSPGSVETTPPLRVEEGEFWVREGEIVALEATPGAGFAFLEWTGLVAGDTNPTAVTANTPGEVGAVFELTYDVPDETSVSLEAARPGSFDLEAVRGTAPVVWEVVEGALPEGLTLLESGGVGGEAIATGTFRVTVKATDARGLEALGVLVLEVSAPAIATDDLLAPLVGDAGGPTASERLFLDGQGNRDGAYDLGDFRAYVVGNPELVERAGQTVAEVPAPERGPLPLVVFPEEGGGP